MDQDAIITTRKRGVADEVAPDRREVTAQLERILRSSQFRNAPTLCSLLRFITERAFDSDGQNLNEYVIASEVFGRSADFDSSVDTIVRTQAYRLRSKLNEYYSGEGARDPVAIEIPKGHYVPMFQARALPRAQPGLVAPDQLQTKRAGWRHYLAAALITVICGVGFSLGLLVGGHRSGADPRNAPNEVDSFWLSFVGTDRQPVVAFTNSVFVATDSGDLLRFVDGPVSSRGAVVDAETARKSVANRNLLKQAGETYYEDDMTGVGEVAAAVALSRALGRIGAHPVFKRSRLISSSDLQNHNVIFLGSPSVNRILDDLPKKPGFLFNMEKARAALWGGTIVNPEPRAGESPVYSIERAPGTGVVSIDYALVSQLPGLSAGRKLLVLAGLTTTGTEAAAEFTTSPEGVRTMAERLQGKGWPAAFDYLLRVKLSQGIDVIRAECIAAR